MKIKLFFLLLFTTILSFSQNNNIGVKYSFSVEITNEEMAQKMKNKPEFQFSKTFKVFYTEKGLVRYIKKSNNFIQSNVFNNVKNEFTLFDASGIISKKTGEFNRPKIKSEKKLDENSIRYNTKTGAYTYFYDKNRLEINSLNFNHLGEHCFNKFIYEFNVLPEKIIYELGFMKFKIVLLEQIELNRKEVKLLNGVIERPDKNKLKKLFKFFRKKNNEELSDIIFNETKVGGKLDFFSSIKGKEYNGFMVKPGVIANNFEIALYKWGKTTYEFGVGSYKESYKIFSRITKRNLTEQERILIKSGFNRDWGK